MPTNRESSLCSNNINLIDNYEQVQVMGPGIYPLNFPKLDKPQKKGVVSSSQELKQKLTQMSTVL
ncbi:hypothetical protein HI914_05056 [Erysiphe necator]|nr:hypothetical protein HI914_05056 [Erysiphe necator]